MKSTREQIGGRSSIAVILMVTIMAGAMALPIDAKAEKPKCVFRCTTDSNGIETCKGNGPQCDGVDPHAPTKSHSVVKRPIPGADQTQPIPTRAAPSAADSMR